MARAICCGKADVRLALASTASTSGLIKMGEGGTVHQLLPVRRPDGSIGYLRLVSSPRGAITLHPWRGALPVDMQDLYSP